MLSVFLKASVLIFFVTTLIITAGCFSSDNDSTAITPSGWVTITSPADADYANSDCDTLVLSGEAFISGGHSDSTSVVGITGVTVSWINLTTGVKGVADQFIDYCSAPGGPLYPCDHTWSANVPLIIGENMIEVTALDPGSPSRITIIATDNITVLKSQYTYEVSGLLTTNEGAGLGHLESGIQFELSGDMMNSITTPDSDDIIGEYKFTCVPIGTYTITPVSTLFDYTFDPNFRTAYVQGIALSGLNFTTNVYEVSGKITDPSGAGLYYEWVEIKNSSSVSRVFLTNLDGSYTFSVPAGSYTITPYCISGIINVCETVYFLPKNITIDVIDQGISNLNFIRYPY